MTRQEVTLIEANTALLINRTEQLQRQADENQSAIKAAIARINALTPVRRAYVMSIFEAPTNDACQITNNIIMIAYPLQ